MRAPHERGTKRAPAGSDAKRASRHVERKRANARRRSLPPLRVLAHAARPRSADVRASAVLRIAALLLATNVASGADMSSRDASVDYSVTLDKLWDFDQPALSEQRFRAEAAKQPPRSREGAEAATQIARAQGLQRKFGDADLTLDAVQRTLDAQPARVRVRYLLERGRRDNSSQRRASAIQWFEQALAASGEDTLPGASYYRVDALHMLAIASPAEQQVDWNKRAIATAQSSDDARTQRWRIALFNNIGWTLHDRGDFQAALEYWRQALAAAEQDGHDATRTRIARWTVARGLRSLGKLDEAEAMQRALADELQQAQVQDGYVFEELAEIAVARGDRAAARPWAAKALQLLSHDADLAANEPARLARLAELAESAPPPR